MEVRQIKTEDFEKAAKYLSEATQEMVSKREWLQLFDLWWSEEKYGWVVDDEGEILGFHGYITSNFKVDGKEVVSYSATSWYVSEKAKSLGLLLIKPFFTKEDPGIYFNTTAIPAVSKIYQRLGFTPLPPHKRNFFFFNPLALLRYRISLIESVWKKLARLTLKAFSLSYKVREIKPVCILDKRLLGIWGDRKCFIEVFSYNKPPQIILLNKLIRTDGVIYKIVKKDEKRLSLSLISAITFYLSQKDENLIFIEFEGKGISHFSCCPKQVKELYKYVSEDGDLQTADIELSLVDGDRYYFPF